MHPSATAKHRMSLGPGPNSCFLAASWSDIVTPELGGQTTGDAQKKSRSWWKLRLSETASHFVFIAWVLTIPLSQRNQNHIEEKNIYLRPVQYNLCVVALASLFLKFSQNFCDFLRMLPAFARFDGLCAHKRPYRTKKVYTGGSTNILAAEGFFSVFD